MTAVLPYLLLLSPTVAMMRSDIRTRRIDVRWLVVFAVGTAVVGISRHGVRDAAIFSAANLCLLGIMLFALGAFYGFRRLFLYGLGAGDALFFAAVAPVFDPRSYVIYLIATFMCGAMCGVVSRRSSVPLVGIGGLTLFIHISVGLWMG